MRTLIVCTALLVLGGCGHYEYDLVQPAALAARINTKGDCIVPIAPLEYRLRAYQDHLIVRIYNPTNEQILLVGSTSSIVDPSGQSHALPDQPIPPDSFIKLILPPPPMAVAAGGSNWHFGFGTSYWRHTYDVNGFYDDGFYAPGYYAGYGPDYWTWPNHAIVRLSLTFTQSSKTFTHAFTFRQDKQ